VELGCLRLDGGFFGGAGFFGNSYFFCCFRDFSRQLRVPGTAAIGNIKSRSLENDGDGHKAALRFALAFGAGSHVFIVETLAQLKTRIAFGANILIYRHISL